MRESRIFWTISLGGLAVLAGVDGLFFAVKEPVGGYLFLVLATIWLFLSIAVGVSLGAATLIQRFVKRIAKPSQS